ncbi:hypothetical protein PCK2_000844 [Pneumocystis canis]|nr:hypothetical protein PCK2_000844 [Pneumocystis canis]
MTKKEVNFSLKKDRNSTSNDEVKKRTLFFCVQKMAKKKFIDKKKSVTFHLVHRSQRDPLIDDDEAPSRVLIPSVFTDNKDKFIKQERLNQKLSEKEDIIGESIVYGITYDDSEYNYMQHLREIGKTPNAILLQAPTHQNLNIIQELPKDVFPSKIEKNITYQDQQSFPDNISGFQPDMDPELREVLLALDDDRYLSSDEDGDLDTLIKSGKTNDSNVIQNPEEDGWNSDNTIKAFKEAHNTKSEISDDNDNLASQELLQYKKKKI